MIAQPKRTPRLPEQPLAFIIYMLRHCSRALKWRLLAAYTLQSTATAADMTVAWVLGRIVGVITTSGDQLWPHVVRELWLLAGLWCLRNAAYRGREYLERRYVPEMMDMTRELLFNRLIQQNHAFLHSNFAGVLANHVRRAADVISNLLYRTQENIIPLIVRFITASALLWSITPLFAVFILSFLALGIFSARQTAARWTDLATTMAEKSSRLAGYITDSITNLSLVQQNVGWREEQSRLHGAHGDLTRAFSARLTYVSWFWGSFDVVMTFFFCGFMALLAWSWQQGNVDTAQLAMCVGIVSNLFGAIAGTVWIFSSGFEDIGTLKDALRKISTPLSIRDADGTPALKMADGAVEFRDVDFSYVEGRPLFEGLNIKIPAGQKVGFVGVSGAGKTTLCQLLMRSYDVNDGGIYIDGQNIASVTQDSLHAAIAVIPQDPVLFHRTLEENIRYGRLTATAEEVRAAAQAAAVDTFIEGLPEQYDTLVGERGIKLSGGQRQRIAIARAIVKNAPILVLDEATSALDSETEKSIQSAMAEAMKGRTTLVIAHRLSTLSHMDRIIVMDQGRVLEDGSFNALLEKQGMFHRLWTLQAGGFLPETLE